MKATSMSLKLAALGATMVRVAVISPKTHSMSEAVAIMTGATSGDVKEMLGQAAS